MFRLEMLSDFDLDELLLDRLRDAAPASLSQTRPVCELASDLPLLPNYMLDGLRGQCMAYIWSLSL